MILCIVYVSALSLGAQLSRPLVPNIELKATMIRFPCSYQQEIFHTKWCAYEGMKKNTERIFVHTRINMKTPDDVFFSTPIFYYSGKTQNIRPIFFSLFFILLRTSIMSDLAKAFKDFLGH
ncbi:hypothetical protein BCR42DRAFT_6245 [Absidia repens]|uniref:Uncharacterized protein n=1 Tax=Absidia repens TaxID=90262 RepID=A0A1X2J0M8_9FUNG|nr:hypothetical protein BCR42DRAFT_6245 [Absidia repens]